MHVHHAARRRHKVLHPLPKGINFFSRITENHRGILINEFLHLLVVSFPLVIIKGVIRQGEQLIDLFVTVSGIISTTIGLEFGDKDSDRV